MPEPVQKMTVHNLYIFDKNGVLLHYSEWQRLKNSGIPMEEVSAYNPFECILFFLLYYYGNFKTTFL